MNNRALNLFNQPLLDLFIKVFNLKYEVLQNEGEKKLTIKKEFDSFFKNLVDRMKEANPDITVIISYDNTFYTNSDIYYTDYKTFCRLKSYFSMGGSPVTFIPSNFKNFKEFVDYQKLSQ
jgi:hypothetical protein